MKKEKGSALLTVILIASVTATIGVAISSFILMNYRFRLYDTHIRRAEYAAEEIIDKTYLYVQRDCYDIFNDIAIEAYDAVSDEFMQERDRIDDGDTITPIIYHKLDVDGNYVVNEAIMAREAEKKYDDKVDSAFTDELNKKLEDIFNGYGDVSMVDNFDNIDPGTSKAVEIGTIGEDSGKIIQPLYIYYRIPNNAVIKSSPWVRFSVNIIISKPEYEAVRETRYDIRNYVGISNWSIDNDWNI